LRLRDTSLRGCSIWKVAIGRHSRPWRRPIPDVMPRKQIRDITDRSVRAVRGN
jgi:hypothetical protein